MTVRAPLQPPPHPVVAGAGSCPQPDRTPAVMRPLWCWCPAPSLPAGHHPEGARPLEARVPQTQSALRAVPHTCPAQGRGSGNAEGSKPCCSAGRVQRHGPRAPPYPTPPPNVPVTEKGELARPAHSGLWEWVFEAVQWLPSPPASSPRVEGHRPAELWIACPSPGLRPLRKPRTRAEPPRLNRIDPLF